MAGGCPVRHHGMTSGLGCKHSKLGSFGRLFEGCPRHEPSDAALEALGAPNGLMHDARRDSGDAPIPAAYTFFGQFIDHDVTLDTQSELNRLGQEPTELGNLRTPLLDLDCVYGFGPEASPHLYDPSRRGALAEGTEENADDLARSDAGVALIGDPRNDENIFVAQMQLLWIRFHNSYLLANLGIGSTPGQRFERVQRVVRYHYQWIVLEDFLRRLCDPQVYDFAYERIQKIAKGDKKAKYPLCYEANEHGLPMPVEFSVAAYRFGHTTVRSAYPANEQFLDVELFDERFGTEGFSAARQEMTVDWRYQLDVDCCIDPVNMKAIDHLLPDELIRMPDPIVGRTSDLNRSLAFRNLVRGRSLGLPSGQCVADALEAKGYPVTSPLDLEWSHVEGWKHLTAAVRKEITNETPLFAYILRESAVANGGDRLGPLGSAILMEVFGGMLLLCEDSSYLRLPESEDERDYLNIDEKTGCWQPDPCVVDEQCDGTERLTLASIVRYLEH